MTEIALGAEIRREFFADVLQEFDTYGFRVMTHGASGSRKAT
jgi:hypothetical protein